MSAERQSPAVLGHRRRRKRPRLAPETSDFGTQKAPWYGRAALLTFLEMAEPGFLEQQPSLWSEAGRSARVGLRSGPLSPAEGHAAAARPRI